MSSPTHPLKRSLEDQDDPPVKRLALSNSQDSVDVTDTDLFVIDTKPFDSPHRSIVSEEEGELPEEVIETGHTVPIQQSPPPHYSTPHTDHIVSDDKDIKMRSLVNTREAGIIIGKQGSHIADIQAETGMKVMVSQFIQNNADRVMTCLGPLKGYSLAMNKILKRLLEKSDSSDDSNETTVRLLIPSSRMGFVIGKAGARIKEIQEKSGAHISSQGDNMPNSTERCMTIAGDEESVVQACYELAAIIGDHHERKDGPPMLYFDPTSKANLRVSATNRDDSPTRSPDYSPRSPDLRNNNPQSSQAQLQAQLGALYAYYPQLQLLAQYPQLMAQYPQMAGQYQQQYYQQMNQNISQQPSPVQQNNPLPNLNMQSLASLQQSLRGISQQSGQPNLQNSAGIPNLQSFQAISSLQNMQPEQSQQNYQNVGNSSGGSNDSARREITIPSSIVGAFIGKKGVSIKDIRNRTRCKVHID
jgi:transcription antitermination factor NusA-like protein